MEGHGGPQELERQSPRTLFRHQLQWRTVVLRSSSVLK